MDTRLDVLLEHLAALPTDRSLDHLDADVRRAVVASSARSRAAAAIAPLQIGAIFLALTIGVTAGSLTAAADPAHPSGLFAAAADLAPSTLLDGGK